MKTATKYISMCTRIIDLYTQHKPIINGIEGFEMHFTNLHMLLIDLNNEYEESFGHLLPLLKEKESEKKTLENLIQKFNKSLSVLANSPGTKKGKKIEEHGEPDVLYHSSSSEIIEQYALIMSRARSLNKKDIEMLEIQFTRFVLSLPVYRLLEEQIDEINLSEHKTIADIDYLLIEQIDPQMNFFKPTSPALFANYQEARKQGGARRTNHNKTMNGAVSVSMGGNHISSKVQGNFQPKKKNSKSGKG